MFSSTFIFPPFYKIVPIFLLYVCCCNFALVCLYFFLFLLFSNALLSHYFCNFMPVVVVLYLYVGLSFSLLVLLFYRFSFSPYFSNFVSVVVILLLYLGLPLVLSHFAILRRFTFPLFF